MRRFAIFCASFVVLAAACGGGGAEVSVVGDRFEPAAEDQVDADFTSGVDALLVWEYRGSLPDEMAEFVQLPPSSPDLFCQVTRW